VQKASVLIIEDSVTDQELIRGALEPEGYTLHFVASGEEGVRLLEQEQPDVVLLDVMLPGMDGLATCRQIRARSSVPLLMVTGKNDEVDRVIGLELGADDYLGKPFGLRELVARVRALLRRMDSLERVPLPQRHVSLPGLEIDLTTRAVLVNEVSIQLTPKEFDLLYALAGQPSRVFSREELMEKVWGYLPEDSDYRTVDTHVKRLRHKLEECHRVPWSIATVWGVGYKFQLRE